jgi:hypothetical protein
MKGALIVLVCSGCTALQSARTLAPGKTELTVGLGRAASSDRFEDGDWSGRLMVRHGLADGFDFGLAVDHTPGTNGTGAIEIDPKVRVTRNDRTTLALGVPAGFIWFEGEELETLGFALAPSMYLSLDAAPSVELISNVRYVFNFVENITGSRYERTDAFGASFGLRFTEKARTWAVTPEFGLLRVPATKYTGQATYLTFGLSIAVGN